MERKAPTPQQTQQTTKQIERDPTLSAIQPAPRQLEATAQPQNVLQGPARQAPQRNRHLAAGSDRGKGGAEHEQV